MADEGRIRVELSQLSGESTKTAEMLRDTVQQISTLFDWLRTPDFRDSVNKLAQLNDQMRRDTDRYIQEGQAMQQRGYSTQQAVQNVAAAAGDPGAVRVQAQADLAQQQRQREEERLRTDRDTEQAKATTERDKMRDREEHRQSMTDQQRQADRRRAAANLPVIGGPDDDPKAWYNRVDSLKGEATGFRIPRFGELNIQDYLNLVGDRLTDAALDPENKGINKFGIQLSGEQAGQRAAQVQWLSNRAGEMFAGWRGVRAAHNFLGREGIDPMQWADVGAQLGYDRQSNNFLGLVQTPFNSAGAEGLRQTRDTLRMRWMSGIDQQQAQAITDATAASGFGGDLGSDIRMKFLAPAFRQFGVDPNSLTPMTQTLRTGTASIADLNAAIANLGQTAQSAHMTVNETAQALNSAGEAAQQMGGSYIRGYQFGNLFQNATGLPATTGTALAQNPYVQAFTAARTGMPGFAQGALDPVSRMRGQYDALRSLVAGFAGMPGHTETVRDPKTHQIYREVTTATDAQIGAAANRLGIDYDEARKMMASGGRANAMELAQAATDDYARGSRQRTEAMDPKSVHNRRSWIERQFNDPQSTQYDLYNTTRNHRWENGQLVGTDDYGNTVTIGDRKTVNQYGEKWGAAQGKNNLANLQRLAKDAGVDADTIKAASHKKGRTAQAAAFRGAIEEKQRESNAQYQIAFTGEAERYFKALAKKSGINPPGPYEPTNAPAASPQGPSPTGQPLPPGGQTGG